MNRSDDITKLFQLLGDSAAGYRELSALPDYPAATAPVPSQPTAAAAPAGPIAASRRNGRHNGPTVIALISLKGGVGRSTLSAALACVLENPQGRTLAIDFDPQNALCQHLGIAEQQPGLAQAQNSALPWDSLILRGHSGSLLLPYGEATAQQQQALEHALGQNPRWLREQLLHLGLGPQDQVIIDTRAGASSYLWQVLEVADLLLVPLLPDAAGYRAVDQFERLAASCDAQSRCRYLINQVSPARTFDLAMVDVLRDRLGERLLGTVQQDSYLSESQAYERNPMERPEQTPAGRDILRLACAIAAQLAQRSPEESLPS